MREFTHKIITNETEEFAVSRSINSNGEASIILKIKDKVIVFTNDPVVSIMSAAHSTGYGDNYEQIVRDVADALRDIADKPCELPDA